MGTGREAADLTIHPRKFHSHQHSVRKDCKNALLRHMERANVMFGVSFATQRPKPARLLLLAATAAMLASGPSGTLAASPPTLQRIGTLSVPGKPL